MAEQNDQDSPKIQVDSDWKAEAQREKEKMARQRQGSSEAESSQGGQAQTRPPDESSPQGEQPQDPQQPGQQELPEASFETLTAMLATQALLYLGEIADPQSGQQIVHLDLAKHHIDLLGVLEDKTKGNITDEEQRSLASTVYELRSRYVQAADAQRQKG